MNRRTVSRWGRPPRERLAPPALAIALLLGLAAAATGSASGPGEPGEPGRVPSGSAPPLQLVETVPVETQLGNPELPAARDVWLEMIQGARRTIDLEQFYVSTWPGEPLEPVLAEIGRAAGRGVRVRILIDAGMHETSPQPADSLGKVPGIEVRLLDMKKLAGGIQHAKLIMVDGEQVFEGSQNFDWRSLEHIHELGVRVRDRRVAAAFGRVFEMDWARGSAPGPETAAASAATVAQPVPARPALSPEGLIPIVEAPGDTALVWTSFSPGSLLPDSTAWDLDALARLLDGARHEVVAQFLSYGTGPPARRDTTLDGALRRAAARGVRVKLIVSDWEAGGHGMPDFLSLMQVPNLQAKLSRVPEWSKGYIPFARVEHCKYLVVDSLWTWVGTSNWEPSYFHATRNAALTLRNRRLALQARRIFEASWDAKSALLLQAGGTYEPRVHAETPPPGESAYGR